MPRLSHHDYLVKLENIRTAMLRGFTDSEICTAEKIGIRQLERYKLSIEKRGLKSVPLISEKQIKLFVKQLHRWEDVIRQANRVIMSMSGSNRMNPAALLRVISEATKNIVEYSQRMGLLPVVAQKHEISGFLNVKDENELDLDGYSDDEREELRRVARLMEERARARKLP